jgi:hypothetical protein
LVSESGSTTGYGIRINATGVIVQGEIYNYKHPKDKEDSPRECGEIYNGN